jgi:hypothetical protein
MATFDEILEQLLAAYAPSTVTYTPMDQVAAAEQIAAWLRPGYDAAIADREAHTDTTRAELDADAWARGMGSSSYVTDVKARQEGYEADDVREMEADYSAKLAQYLFAALEEDRARGLEVAMFNAEQENDARSQAADAASAFIKITGGSGSGKKGTSGSTSKSTSKAQNYGDSATLEMLQGMSAQEQERFFDSANPNYHAQRNALLQEVGAARYNALREHYGNMRKTRETTAKRKDIQRGSKEKIGYPARYAM